MNNTIKFLILLLITNCITQANAKLIKKCGTYSAEGYYKKSQIFLLDRGTDSEVTLSLKNYHPENTRVLIQEGDPVQIQFKLLSSCDYFCEGILTNLKQLKKLEKLKSFWFPFPSPIKNTEIKCKNNLP